MADEFMRFCCCRRRATAWARVARGCSMRRSCRLSAGGRLFEEYSEQGLRPLDRGRSEWKANGEANESLAAQMDSSPGDRGYHLLVAIEKTLLDQGVHSSWASVRDALATHAIVTIVLPTDSGATLRIRKASTAESEHRELYRLLGVDETIMSSKTIWSEIADRE